MKDLTTLAQEYHSRYCELNRLNITRRDTLRTYLRWFVGWLADKAQIARPDQFSCDVILAWHRYVSARPCRRTGLPQQPGSIYTEVQTVRRFCEWMRRDGYVSSAVVESFPRMREPARRPQTALRHAEARQYLESLPMNEPVDYLFRALTEFFYTSGVRASEALQLNVADVDLADRKARVMGKGQNERMVPIGRTAARHLEIYISGVRPLLLRDRSEKALWLNRNGQRLGYGSIKKLFAAAGKDPNGIRVRPHLLRRSCATEMIRGGSSIWAVKELLGHDDLRTLEDYVLLDLNDLKEMHRRFHPRDLPTPATPGTNPSQHGNRNHITPMRPEHGRRRNRSQPMK